MRIYVINICPENLSACLRDSIFGIPESDKICYRLNEGDLTLARLAHKRNKDYGCVGVWGFLRDERVPFEKRHGPNDLIPWDDTAYQLKQYFRELIRFNKPLCENFVTKRKISTKLGWSAEILRGSMKQLSPKYTYQYVSLLLKEKEQEMDDSLSMQLRDYLR